MKRVITLVVVVYLFIGCKTTVLNDPTPIKPSTPSTTIASIPKSSVDEINVVERTIPVSPSITLINKKGIAFWEEDQSIGELLVLHNSAKMHTKIILYNPMMNKTVEALVIGTIPDKTYSKDISIVVSSGVAKALGVLDSRFMIHMKYQPNDKLNKI